MPLFKAIGGQWSRDVVSHRSRAVSSQCASVRVVVVYGLHIAQMFGGMCVKYFRSLFDKFFWQDSTFPDRWHASRRNARTDSVQTECRNPRRFGPEP